MHPSLKFRIHAIKRMFERSISEKDIQQILMTGQIVEEYPTAFPYPCQLILGRVQGRPIHVVVADNVQLKEKIIITVYEPTLDRWEADFIRRRRK